MTSKFDFFPRPNALVELLRMLDDNAPFRYRRVPVDVHETGQEVVVEADLPGWKKEALSLRLAGRVLHISGTRKVGEQTGQDYFRSERRLSEFNEEVELPATVLDQNIKARLEQGVLVIRLQKAQREEGQEIVIE
ncbi:MAG: Hsp20/alpha crystallin family protein [Eubacteriales bacterium]|jgi:HSP20 family protein|nr:Hsp20/alpha crystallin family protein [Bacillota bacterium]MBV1728076.1 Hsp20/alpha crystallin family protein [Desulforudis sp.]MDP3051445.1 Hsp20/alpha crystallin family protein [Eubacteriales bacterium]MDQ7788650.1 Hsp20/alpha crystallin family protein [Clostridia bacterium]MBU4532514.1 Hsp20/alpha crystallin family protein [Bacillota bacterium]